MKQFISNRKNQKLAVMVEAAVNPQGLVFIMHGLGGFKEQPHLQAMADSFKENNYTVIRFDAADTIGESGGQMENATATNYYQDLQDVIIWGKTQTWYQEPFVLAGHSLGAGCALLYTENFPAQIKAVAPIATVVSGKFNYEVHTPEVLAEWKKVGYRLVESVSKPGVMKKISWALMEDILQYDLLTKVDKLTMPVLMIVGDQDKSTPLAHQQILYDQLTGSKEFHVIKNAEHTFRQPEQWQEIKEIFDAWIKKLNRL